MPDEYRADHVVRTATHEGALPDCYCCSEQEAIATAEERLPAMSILLVWRVHSVTQVGELVPWRAYP